MFQAEIPFAESFKFNNSAVFAQREDESNEYYWKFGFSGLQLYFAKVCSLNFNVLSYFYFSFLDLQVGAVLPVSLTLTRQVLDERQTLMLLLDGLQKRISDGFEALNCLENTTQ